MDETGLLVLGGAVLVSAITTITGVVVGVVRGDEQKRRARLNAHFRPYAAARSFTLSGGKMSGMVDGVEVLIDTVDGMEAGEPCVLTRVTAKRTGPPAKKLLVFPESPLVRILRADSRDVPSGDLAFDRVFVVRGEEPGAHQLLDPGMRQALLRFGKARQLQLHVEGRRASLRWVNPFASDEALDEACRIVVAAARGPRTAYR